MTEERVTLAEVVSWDCTLEFYQENPFLPADLLSAPELLRFIIAFVISVLQAKNPEQALSLVFSIIWLNF